MQIWSPQTKNACQKWSASDKISPPNNAGVVNAYDSQWYQGRTKTFENGFKFDHAQTTPITETILNYMRIVL